ncbi:MAG: hypothetical protein AAGG08_00370, partial [Actinomycetota bacterium]
VGLALGAGTPATRSWNQNSSGVRGESELADFFSDSMTAADWNGDGFTDLGIGVPDEQTTPDLATSRAGAVNVLYGSASGLTATDDEFLAGGFEPIRAAFEAAFGPAGRDQQFGYSLDDRMDENDWLDVNRAASTAPRIDRVSSRVDGVVLVLWEAPIDTGGGLLEYTVTGPGDLRSVVESTTDLSFATFANVPTNEEGTFTVSVKDRPDLSASETFTPRGALRPLSPARLLDTRRAFGSDTIDGRFEGVGRVGAGDEIQLDVWRGGVPTGAAAVMLNVTAVGPTGPGFVTVYPCGGDLPLASNLNHGPGDVVPNSVFTDVSASGEVCLFTRAETDLVVDVTGYVPDQGTTVGIRPARYLETRAGESTFDGRSQPGVRLAAQGEVRVPIAGRGEVPAETRTAFVNVTVVGPSGPGFLTLYPCGSDRPGASTVNFGAGDVRANAAMVALPDSGELCIFSSAETDVLVDVNGYVDRGQSGSPSAATPQRLADTRQDGSAETVDGESEAIGRLDAGAVLRVDVAGRGPISEAWTTAATVNVAAIAPARPGFLTVYPCDEDRPTASNVNYRAGDVVSNGALAKLASDGSICVFTSASADVLVDVTGSILGPDPVLRD